MVKLLGFKFTLLIVNGFSVVGSSIRSPFSRVVMCCEVDVVGAMVVAVDAVEPEVEIIVVFKPSF